jgi:arylsulfatase A-like enzyme
VGVVVLATLVLFGCSGENQTPPRRIVVVTWDTTRADRLGCYGYDQPTTPNLDRFAEEAVLFEQAVSPVPTTLPSHSSMFTGLYPQDHGVRYNIVYRLEDELETLAERLGAAGYRTAGFPAALVLADKYGLSQGFEHWSQPTPAEDLQDVNHPLGGTRIAGAGVDEALEWLAAQGDASSFLWLHFYDPHGPFTPPFPYSSQFRDKPYDGEIAYTDAQFGRLLDALRDDPAWDETLVVMAGDHGEGLQDHGESWHSYLLYETTQRVPLIVRAPGYEARRVEQPVALPDIAPTVLDLAGLEPLEGIRGVSLADAMGGGDPPSRFIYFETHAGALNYGWQKIAGVRFANWKLIDPSDSSAPELYDLAQDPGETTNLATRDPERVARFQRELRKVAEPIRESNPELADKTLSPEQQRAMAALGYVGGATGGDVPEDALTPMSQIHLETEMTAAQVAIQKGNWVYVEDLCRYIQDNDPNNKWALTNLITALLELGRAGETEEYVNRLVAKYPGNSNTYMTAGRALSEMGKPDEAYKLLRQGRDNIADDEHIGYLTIVAAFDAGRPVCDAEIGTMIAEFPASGRLRMLNARCVLRGNGGVDAAFEQLNLALQFGYRELESLRLFEEFEPVVADARFEALVEGLKRGKTYSVQTFPASPANTE